MAQKKKTKKMVFELGANPFAGKYLLVHGYLIAISILVNTLIYVGVTQPAISGYFTGSYLDAPESHQAIEQVLTRNNGIFQQQVDSLQRNIQLVQGELQELKKDAPVDQEPQVIVEQRVIERVVEVASDDDYQRRRSAGSGPRTDDALKGALLVKDDSCESGYSWMSPRLERWCAEEGDFID